MVKTITERPIIVANIAKQTWRVVYNSKTKQFEFLRPGEIGNVKIKEETKNTGVYELTPQERTWDVILPNGTIARSYDCKKANISWEIDSFQKALDVLKKMNRKEAYLTRKKVTYYNPKTQATTSDKATALAWFPNKEPLILSACPYQRVGMWVDPGTNYVDISIYYIDGLSRKTSSNWKKATDTGFRLYNDGTISNFWMGKVHEKRTFEENRRTYHQLDIRSRQFYRSMGNMADLRSSEIVGAESDARFLCKETLDILKKAGFPDYLWCWGNCKRKFDDPYDLVNFAKFPQKHTQTKNGASIEEFLKDKPFTPDCELVESFNKGVLIRVPGFSEEWKDGRGQFYHYRPYVEKSNVIKLVNASCYERYRIWLSNDGKKRSCQELVHDRTEWKRVNWDHIPFLEESDLTPREIQDLSPKEQRTYKDAWGMYKKMVSKKMDKIFTLLPALQHIKEFIAQYPQLSRIKNLKAVLTAMYDSPKTTETIIKIGHGDWFFQDPYGGCYGHNADGNSFSLDHVLQKFGLSSCGYKEDKRKSLYQNLGVSKEQFEWLGTYKYAYRFTSQFKTISIPIPGKHQEFYESFAAVPLKHIQTIARCCEVWASQGTSRDDYKSWEVSYLIRDHNYTPLDLQKVMDKNLNLSTLRDYLRMRRELHGVNDFNIDDWDKVPDDNTDLTFCHNRIIEFYNLYQANRERYYREQQEKRLLEYQENYNKRYKTLKTLAYENKTNERCIVVPQKLIELTVEGQVLHHCVGSFAQSVSEGRDTIVFLRRKDAPKVPYATISLLKNGEQWYIDQAHTKSNGPITEEDVEFLKEWAQGNNVDTNSIKTTYGWKCHH